MNTQELITKIKEQKITNTKFEPDALEKFLKANLEIKEYIPFAEKREIAEMVVNQNTHEVDGIWRNDSVSQYVSFVVAMILSHTSLEVDIANPIADYDILCESKLLTPIIEMFRQDYDEINVLVKMILSNKLEENSINAIIAKFLSGINDKLDGVIGTLGKVNIQDFVDKIINKEDLAKLKGFLNKQNN